MSRNTYATINLSALQHNLQRVREFAPNTKIMAMIKANAYGHGMQRVAPTLSDADYLGVASIEEAVVLRQQGITQNIILIEGFFEATEIDLITQNHFDIVIHHWQQIEVLESIKIDKPINCWLKCDSGMHRLGFNVDEFKKAWQRLDDCSNVKEINLMTHFACADEIDNDYTQQQINIFNTLTKDLPGQRSLANSAAIMQWPKAHQDVVRPGIMLYGSSPFANKTGLELQLKPVMTLHSQLMAIHSLQAGDCVGYGSTWCCPEAMLLGVIAIGYGDGYPRHVPNGTSVLVNGKRMPIVGRVSMDMVTVDLRQQPTAKLGDPVVLWGEELPIDEIAAAAGTIAYELLCQVTSRVTFKYI